MGENLLFAVGTTKIVKGSSIGYEKKEILNKIRRIYCIKKVYR